MKGCALQRFRLWLSLVRKGLSEQEEKAPKEGVSGTFSQVPASPLSLLRSAWLVCFGLGQAELSQRNRRRAWTECEPKLPGRATR